MSDPMDYELLRHVFVEECNEGLDSIAASLITLEAEVEISSARGRSTRTCWVCGW